MILSDNRSLCIRYREFFNTELPTEQSTHSAMHVPIYKTMPCSVFHCIAAIWGHRHHHHHHYHSNHHLMLLMCFNHENDDVCCLQKCTVALTWPSAQKCFWYTKVFIIKNAIVYTKAPIIIIFTITIAIAIAMPTDQACLQRAASLICLDTALVH